MRRKFLFSLAALLAGVSPCLAQVSAAPASRNAVFLELLGNGGVYSINYERMVNDRLGIHLGYGVWSSPLFFQGTPPNRYQSVPVSVSYLFGSGERKLEIGGGVTFGRGMFDRGSGGRDFSFRSLTAVVGYRSQPRRRGYLFRAGLTPFYSFEDGEEAYPDPGFTFSAGVSFGYRF